MKPCGIELIVQESALEIFDCQNLWTMRRDGLFGLRLSLEGAKAYLDKYKIKTEAIEQRDFYGLTLNGVQIGVAQPLYTWNKGGH